MRVHVKLRAPAAKGHAALACRYDEEGALSYLTHPFRVRAAGPRGGERGELYPRGRKGDRALKFFPMLDFYHL